MALFFVNWSSIYRERTIETKSFQNKQEAESFLEKQFSGYLLDGWRRLIKIKNFQPSAGEIQRLSKICDTTVEKIESKIMELGGNRC